MDPYGPTHLAALAVLVAGVPVMVLLGRRERRTGDHTVTRVFGIAIPVLYVPTQVVDVATRFDKHVSLPLQLCDVAWMVAAVALLTRHRYPVAITYFWSVLTLQAILTPSLSEDAPDLRFFAYWMLHGFVVWATVLLVAGMRLGPGWRDYRVALAVTLAWAVVAYAVNVLIDTNYGYLRGKPGRGSILDLFGPWPFYLLVEVAIVGTAWALMTWPWAVAAAGPGRVTGPRRPTGLSGT